MLSASWGLWVVMKSWLLILFCFTSPVLAAFQVPPLQGPVNDIAGMLTANDRERLDSALRRLSQEGGSQVAVLTVPTLGGETIEQASMSVADAWKLGHSKVDNGVLLLVSKQEKKIRIEVGRGLEGVLPDIYARRIVSDIMVPLFREQKASAGIVAGVVAICGYTDPKAALGLAGPQPPPSNPDSDDRNASPAAVVFLIILVLIVMFFNRRRGFGGWWGGGGGRGGGGDGGFSGGGGGFNGGGASDGW